MIPQQLIRNNWLIFVKILGALLLTIFTFQQLEPIYIPTLDGCMWWVLNYLPSTNLIFGKDIFFAYGPWGWMHEPVFENSHYIIALTTRLLVLVLYFFTLIKIIHSNKDKVLRIIGYVFWIAYHLLFGKYIMCFEFLGLQLFILGQLKKTNRLYPILLGILCAFGIMLRSSYGIIFSVLILIDIIFRLKNRLKLNYFLSVLTAIFTLIIFWIIEYGKLDGLIGYLKSILLLSGGLSDGLGLYPLNNYYLIGIGIICIVISLILYAVKRKSWNLSIGLLLLSYLFWKHGIVREDANHVKYFLYGLLGIGGYLFLLLKREHIYCVLLYFVGFGCLIYNFNVITFKRNVLERSDNGSKYFFQCVLNQKEYRKECDSITKLENNVPLLDKKVLDIIGKKTVDVYPFNLSIVYLNHLNWTPRPMIQSPAYQPFFDSLNADFINGINAPEFILSHLESTTADQIPYADFDGRNWQNNEPSYNQTLNNKYKLIYSDQHYSLFKNTLMDLTYSNDFLTSKQSIRFGDWINVNNNKYNYLKLEFPTNLLNRALKLLWKSTLIHIQYKLVNGKIVDYKFNPAMGKAFIKFPFPFFDSPVQQIRLTHPNIDFPFLVDKEFIFRIAIDKH